VREPQKGSLKALRGRREGGEITPHSTGLKKEGIEERQGTGMHIDQKDPRRKKVLNKGLHSEKGVLLLLRRKAN